MSKRKLILISCLSGVLLSLAWLDLLFAPLMLVAFVPMLWVEQYISKNNEDKRFSACAGFAYSYLPFLIWNATTIFWVSFSTPAALVLPFFQAALMSLAFQLFHWAKRVFGVEKKINYVFFIIFFLAFEFVELHWDFNFPWLNLGNSFAKYPALVQWYEFTGVAGGSLWILISNVFVLFFLNGVLEKYFSQKINYFLGIILALPIIISLTIFFTFKEEKTQGSDVVVVQPNLDPYEEQYSLSPQDVCLIIENLALQKADKETDFVLCPESCIQEYAWEEYLEETPSIEYLRNLSNRFPRLEFIAGMSSRKQIDESQKTIASRLHKRYGFWYENYNTAIKIDRDTLSPQSQIRHKSVLTPAVEKMPLQKYLGFMENFILDLGGTVGSLGTDKDFKVFSSENKPKTATAICYESVDGQYVANLVKSGAELLFIITNDGWWKNTPGHRQHASFASLRAIENRRYIARSANTGISSFVSPKGNVLQKTKYWEEDVIKQTLYPQTKITFYTKHGDYIYRTSSFLAVLSILLAFVYGVLRKKKNLTIN
ncbi:MAG: apolipoprotein N-acyltransferase [Bacteroidales bacterium]|nr:apolipoprotein N-acyltransferase [Bacteroidales bacterium]